MDKTNVTDNILKIISDLSEINKMKLYYFMLGLASDTMKTGGNENNAASDMD